MKYKHIAAELIALSLIAIAFVSSVAAAKVYYPRMEGVKAGKNLTFIIYTTSDSINGPFSGLDVDETSIVLTVYDTKDLLHTIPVDASAVTLSADRIVIQLIKQDGFPAHANAIHATGNIGSAGDAFYASGPGWGWANIH